MDASTDPYHLSLSPSLPLVDFVLVAVIILSKKYKMNPDNLATPLAASIGDVVAISLLSFIASLLFQHLGKIREVASGIGERLICCSPPLQIPTCGSVSS